MTQHLNMPFDYRCSSQAYYNAIAHHSEEAKVNWTEMALQIPDTEQGLESFLTYRWCSLMILSTPAVFTQPA